jgi:MinD-like ATPase involved in chromosome partitioning or flagellar assembly
MASGPIGLLEENPLLAFCGAARTATDLLRLLGRFRPQVLMVSGSMLDELASGSLEEPAWKILAEPLSFLITGLDPPSRAEDVERMLSLPLRYCGIINMHEANGEGLFKQIREKISLYSAPSAPRDGRAEGRPPSRFIMMLGCKGGVGTTILSCALSSALAASGGRVLLMDMDSDLSQLLHLRGSDAGKHLLDLLPVAEEVSWDLVTASVEKHPRGFYILPYGFKGFNPDNPGKNISSLLRNMLFLFDTVVMDHPRFLSRDILGLLHHSPGLMLLSLPDTLCVNCVRRKLDVLKRSGLEGSQVGLLLNRCHSRQALAPDEIGRATGLKVLGCVPEDEDSGRDFAELGQVPRIDSPLGRAVGRAAASAGYGVYVETPSGRRGFKPLRKRYGQAALEGW